MDPSTCDSVRTITKNQQCTNHLIYLEDLCSKFNAVQKRLQGKKGPIIQARIIILGFQAKVEVFNSRLACND